jgi:hypothetical protein
MSGKDAGDDHTEIVRHVKVTEADRLSGDTDDLPTHFITAKSNEPVAKLVIVGGPGAGNARPVFAGTNSVGREASNRVPLDFGDDTISRKQHAVIVVDPTNGALEIRDGGKVNPILVNGKVVSGKAPVKIGDTIELGTTTLLVQGV